MSSRDIAITVDTSCWVAIARAEPVAPQVIEHLEAAVRLVVPATTVYEMRRWLLTNDIPDGDGDAIIAVMQSHDVVPMDASIASRAAVVSVTTGLAQADAVILTTARTRHAPLLTLDGDFAGLEHAVVLSSPS